jgi:serine/threonine protein kinase
VFERIYFQMGRGFSKFICGDVSRVGTHTKNLIREESTAPSPAFDPVARFLYITEERNIKIETEHGRGTFGIVFCAKEISTSDPVATRKVAVKRGLKNPEHDSTVNERGILSMMDHPHIVKLYSFASAGGLTAQVMESCKDGELFNLISANGPLSESVAKSYFHQILLALNYLHTVAKIVHRDLKPENILLTADGKIVKLCDFGTAMRLSRGLKASGRIGSLSYAAPEVYSSSTSDFASDVWSSGVLLYVMFCAASPFRSAQDKEPERQAMERVKKGDINKKRENWKSMPPQPKELLLKLLRIDSILRPTAFEALQDPWFESFRVLHAIETEERLVLVRGLVSFAKMDESMRNLWIALAQQMPDWDEALRCFEKIDLDQDGLIGPSDLMHLGFPTQYKAWFSYSEIAATLITMEHPATRKNLVGGALPFAYDSIKDTISLSYGQYAEQIHMYSSPILTS